MVETLRFLPAHLELFSRASHDVNPLHMDEGYARRTAYGERVVFGALGALAALGKVRARPGTRLSRLTLEFPSPLLMGVDYQLSLEEVDERTEVTLSDGRRVALRARAEWVPRLDEDPGEGGATIVAGGCQASEPANLKPCDMYRGFSVSEDYAPAAKECAQLVKVMGLEGGGYSMPQIASVLWSSYLVGMRLPGTRALFSKLDLRFDRSGRTTLLNTQAAVHQFNRSFGRVRVEARLSAGETFATATIEAFVREDVPLANLSTVESHLDPSLELAGTHALVVGGSRGLGAGLVSALATQGATVWLAYSRSDEHARTLKLASEGAAGSVALLRGDAADSAFWEDVCAHLPRLDLLVLNAFPAMLPLWVDSESLSRMTSFVHRAWALTATPLAHLGPHIAKSEGTLLTVSTSFVDNVVGEWPHYVAAKFAAEGLTRAFVAENPWVRAIIARPPRLWTDLSNTPLGRRNAAPVAPVAASLVRHILKPRCTGVEVVDSFA